MRIDRLRLKNFPPSAGRDFRYLLRREAYALALRSLDNWKQRPEPEMAAQIGITALSGFYSIWTQVFADEPEVLGAINREYARHGTSLPQIEADTGLPIKRKGGIF